MLVQFTVSNYRSFDGEAVFSLRATSDERHPAHVVDTGKKHEGKALGLLRAAAIYGANGAGKSNLILAMTFAQSLVNEGTLRDAPTGVVPFKLRARDAEEAGRASRFTFIFHHEGTLYSYGFAASARRIHEEWLFATAKSREVCLFQRVTSAEGKVDAEFGPSLRRAEGGKFLDFLAQGTRANQLFLTECAERGVSALMPVIEWFEDVLLPIRAESRYAHLPMEVRFDQDFKRFLGEFLQVAGTGVEGIEAEAVPVNWERHFGSMSVEEQAQLERDVMKLQPDEGYMMVDDRGHRFFLVRSAEDKVCMLEVRTLHTTPDGHTVKFRLEEESEGTQRLVHLLPALFGLRSEPRVFVIDEVDRRLHTLLTRLFVQQALDRREGDPPSQVIFATHDTNLLDLDVLRRDEIWFVEKDKFGASHLASLAEWKVRPDLEVAKGYISGRFGAIPFFGDTSHLFSSVANGAPDAQDGANGHAADSAIRPPRKRPVVLTRPKRKESSTQR